MEELLFKTLIISLVCVGFRMVISKGKILAYFRKPYDWLESTVKSYNEISFSFLRTPHQIIYCLSVLGLYILTPIIGCVVCFGSFWTVIIELTYFKLSLSTLLLIFMVCALNGIIYALYELISAMIKFYSKDSK